MNMNTKQNYNQTYYKLHRQEIRTRRNKGVQNTRELIPGEQFEKLTVVKFFGKDNNGKIAYVCQCQCGKSRIVRRSYLLSGRTKSCGCQRSVASSITGKKTAPLLAKINFNGIGDLSGAILCHIKKNAKIRDIEFTTSKEYLWELYLSQNKECVLTGFPITFGNRYKKLTTTASLDRIDSSMGYIVGNVQWVHKDINMMKRQLSNEQFISLCKTVTKKHENIATKLSE